MCIRKIKAIVFCYFIKPYIDKYSTETLMDCPCCGELLQRYNDCGFVHMADGDADCYGALGVGKNGVY